MPPGHGALARTGSISGRTKAGGGVRRSPREVAPLAVLAFRVAHAHLRQLVYLAPGYDLSGVFPALASNGPQSVFRVLAVDLQGGRTALRTNRAEYKLIFRIFNLPIPKNRSPHYEALGQEREPADVMTIDTCFVLSTV